MTTLYLAYYENRNEEYEYSLHSTEAGAEKAARALVLDDRSNADPDLSFEELAEWLSDEESYSLGVIELELKP